MPASVTVGAGATTATFTVETSTVTSSTTVTIEARYGGVSKTTTLAVTPPAPRAVFTVTSPTRGADSCLLISDPDGTSLDCRLDGTASEGLLTTWFWEIATSENLQTDSRPDGVLIPDISSGCSFLNSASSSVDLSGNRFIDLTVRLRVRDRNDRDSTTTSRAVKLYPDHKCGKDF